MITHDLLQELCRHCEFRLQRSERWLFARAIAVGLALLALELDWQRYIVNNGAPPKQAGPAVCAHDRNETPTEARTWFALLQRQFSLGLYPK